MRNTLIRNSVVAVIWWIVFFPGFYSSDSFAAVNMAKSGDLVNSYTASWAIYVRVFSLFGHFIGLLTLINTLVLVYSVTRFSYALLSKKTAAISSFILTVTPLVAGMGITLWHDILMTAGLLLLAAFFTIYRQESTYSKNDFYSLLVPSAVLLSFRPNGLPTFLVFATLLLIFSYRKSLIRPLAMTLAITAGTTIFNSLVVVGADPINTHYAQEWMRNDISCYAASPAGAGWVEANMPGVGNTQSWASTEACTFLNRYALAPADREKSYSVVPAAWRKLALSDPAFILKTHFDRNYYVVPLPINGLPSIPFLHSTIETANAGVAWAMPSVAEKARVVMRVGNALRPILAYAGMWLLLILGALVLLKRKEWLPTFLLGFSLLGILFVFAPIPDGRYALFVMLAGQLLLIGALVDGFGRIRNRKPPTQNRIDS
jgi:hypothetical protein